MTIHYSDCSNLFEQVIFWLVGASIFSLFVSLCGMYANENKDENPGWLLEIFHPLVHMCTSRYLNEKGAIWRYPYLVSVIVLVVSALLSYLLGHCTP